MQRLALAAIQNAFANGSPPSKSVVAASMINDPGNENWGSGILASFFKLFLTLCAIVSSLTAWKTSRIVKLADLKRKGKIGTRLHAKALKATVNVHNMDDGIALTFCAFSSEADDGDLAASLHGLLASDPASEPSGY